jgi:hypothetical protein
MMRKRALGRRKRSKPVSEPSGERQMMRAAVLTAAAAGAAHFARRRRPDAGNDPGSE